MPKERTIHNDRQVLSFEDLEVGQHYESVHAVCTYIIQLTSEPYLTDAGWKVDYFYESDLGYSLDDTYLTDMGVIAYENGGWHDANYLVQIS